MLKIATKLGFKDLKSLNASIEKDPKLRAQSRQQILDLYKQHIDADVHEAAAALRPAAQGQGRNRADRGVPREGGRWSAVQPGRAGRLAPRAACR